MLIRLTPNEPVLSMGHMSKRFQSRQHAVDALRNMNGRELRELADRGASLKQLQDALRSGIDLADLPDDLADKYAISDRAWHRFLNDVIRDVLGPFAFAEVSR